MENANKVHTENDKSDGNNISARWAVVLLVDDQPMVAEGIRRMIADEPDIEFHYCQDPKQAVQRATEVKATVILQDLVMPEVDGLTLVRFYRNNPATRDVPIIVLSSKDDPKIKSEAFAQNATDYLVKLPEKIELLARIRAHGRSYLAHREREEACAALRKMQAQLETMNQELQKSNRELQRLSSLDGLTGVANRRQFDETLVREWRRAARDRKPVSLIFADIDYFKRYNDHYGHQAGDDTLRKVAQAIAHTVHRPGDLVARYGGEEFVMVLSDTTLEGAMAVAHKVLEQVHELRIPHCNAPGLDHVTLSIGVASRIPEPHQAPETLIEAADRALYRAKETGRNQVMAAAPETADC
ncbi:MAG TPA: diguanylate cyclase [Gammaproteobacteria bacterium]|nr:diguanylate cyclase [Gammaproteobacteria bacterium]